MKFLSAFLDQFCLFRFMRRSGLWLMSFCRGFSARVCRYAKNNKMKKIEGHRLGYLKLRECLDWCQKIGIKVVTCYAFSIDNYKRPQEEVQSLMRLAKEKFREMKDENNRETSERKRAKVRIRILGKAELLPPDIQQIVEEMNRKFENEARRYQGASSDQPLILNICFSYGSFDEMTDAVNQLVESRPSPDSVPNLSVQSLEDRMQT